MRDWELVVTLLGRKAYLHHEAVVSLIAAFGHTGIRISREMVPFSTQLTEPQESGLVGGELFLGQEKARHMANELPIPDEPKRLLTAFYTPLLLKPTQENDQKTGGSRRLLAREKELDLPKLLGNMAFDLCALDCEDRGVLAPPITIRRAMCEAARAFVQEAAEEITVLTNHMSPVDMGLRESRTGNGTFSLGGLTGYVVMKCPPPVVPWIRAMSHWRAGQLGSKGFGEVQVWG